MRIPTTQPVSSCWQYTTSPSRRLLPYSILNSDPVPSGWSSWSWVPPLLITDLTLKNLTSCSQYADASGLAELVALILSLL